MANEAAIESTIRIGLALGCRIATWCRFARKNYFYPDIPKGFQTTQYDEPLCTAGHLDVEVDGETYRVEIERVHLEEDTGKNLHVGGATGRIHGADHSLIDYNRAGIPLVEIVTRPIPGAGAKAPEVAKAYVTELREILLALGVSEVRMEQGNLRCDVNTSLAPIGSLEWGTRTETKNVNSLRSVERAVRFEMRRQAAVLDAGAAGASRRPGTSTRTPARTSPGRSKEEATDYRYFPEPDLVPVAPDEEWVAKLGAALPELPAARRARLSDEWGIAPTEMAWLVNAGAVELVSDTVAAGASPADARKWWLGELARRANDAGVELAELAVTPAQVAELVGLVAAGTINDQLARQALDGVLAGEGDPAEVVEARGLAVMGESDELVAAVDAAIEGNPDVAEKVRGGKVQAIGALVGAVMKTTRGKADAATVKRMLEERLARPERWWTCRRAAAAASAEDFPLLSRWLAEPLVARWWDDDSSLDAVERALRAGRRRRGAHRPVPGRDEGRAVRARAGLRDRDEPEYVEELSPVCPVPPGALSIDYLIGEPDGPRPRPGRRMIAAAVARGFADHPDARGRAGAGRRRRTRRPGAPSSGRVPPGTPSASWRRTTRSTPATTSSTGSSAEARAATPAPELGGRIRSTLSSPSPGVPMPVAVRRGDPQRALGVGARRCAAGRTARRGAPRGPAARCRPRAPRAAARAPARRPARRGRRSAPSVAQPPRPPSSGGSPRPGPSRAGRSRCPSDEQVQLVGHRRRPRRWRRARGRPAGRARSRRGARG